jgi:hypothetical protein
MDFYYKHIGLVGGKTVRVDFLRNGLFRFTQLNQLNDLFEANPQALLGVAPEDEARALEEMKRVGLPLDQKDRWLPMFLKPGLRRMTKEEFPALVYPRGINSLEELDAANLKKELDALVQYVNETYGVFCVTTSAIDAKMWSLYSDNHRGIAVGFDASHPFFKSGENFDAVEYSDQRVSLSSVDGLLRLAGQVYSSNDATRVLPREFFFRKDSRWKDEEEWRMVKKLNDCVQDPKHPDLYLFKVPAEAVKLIILGAKISNDDEEVIRSLATSSKGWDHLKILRAKLSARDFGIELIAT